MSEGGRGARAWLEPYDEADTTPGASVVCTRATFVSSGQSLARLLLANGGFVLWARRTNKNGLVRDTTITKNPPVAWADVTYRKYPAFPEGANPAEPRFWDLCLYTSAYLERMNVGYNASADGARADHLLHKLGSLVRCDPAIPRIQGVSLKQQGRTGKTQGGTYGAAARIEFVKSNDTAALVTEHGAVASIVPNVLHVARAWVRCVKGCATVALVVSSLPETVRLITSDLALTQYDALANISVGSDGAKNILRCKLDPPSDGTDRDASEAESGWTELEVGVMSSKAEHEVSVQLVVHSHSDGAAILVDDVSLEAATDSVPRASTPSDGSSASSAYSTHCSGGGGAGVSFSASHQCSTDPTRLFYRIREKGGVPVAYEQIHAMVTLGYKAISCRKPKMDPVTTAECPHLSQATLPHLSAPDVKR
jgi:hypothetical protein